MSDYYKLYQKYADEADRLFHQVKERDIAIEGLEAEVIRLTPMVTRGALETADAIEALQSEVERLREVLKNIAYFEPDRNSWSVKQARSALEAKP